MRYLLSIILILGFFSVCYADRVCIEKETGKLIEYQSGNASLGILTQNAINAGYKEKDVEEKYVTPEEWAQIRFEQIEKPAKDKADTEKIASQKKKDAATLKLKALGFTKDEIEAILND